MNRYTKIKFKEKNILSDRQPFDFGDYLYCKFIIAPNRFKARNEGFFSLCRWCPRFKKNLDSLCNWCELISCDGCDIEEKIIGAKTLKPKKEIDFGAHSCIPRVFFIFIIIIFIISSILMIVLGS